MQVYCDDVSGECTFDVKRTGEWVAAGRARRARRIQSSVIQSPGPHGIAGNDMESGRCRTGERAVERLRLEPLESRGTRRRDLREGKKVHRDRGCTRTWRCYCALAMNHP